MSQCPEDAVKTLQGMGFLRSDVLEALKKFNNAVEPALEWLLVSKPSPRSAGSSFLESVAASHAQQHVSSPIKIPSSSSESSTRNTIEPITGFKLPEFRHANGKSSPVDAPARVSASLEDENFTPLWPELHMAIKNSLRDQEGKDLTTLEPIDPHKRMRESNLPVGLKNIGCTCYFNSLVQTYYMLPTFRNSILGLEATNDKTLPPEKSPELKALQFVYTLQQLFAYLKLSQRKYVDPSTVFNYLVEIHDSKIKPGTEQDPTEFNMLFMQSISDGLSAHSKIITHGSFIAPAAKNVEEPDLIKHLFLGSSFQTVTAKEADGSTSQVPAAQQFNHIVSPTLLLPFFPMTTTHILDICHGDLYSSLDAYTAPVQLKDYVTGKNFKTPSAFKTETFEKLPRMLTFQLQRVNYDVERKQAVKLNNQFEFDKVIYLDRYMHRNERETARRRERAEALKAEVETLEKELATYEGTAIGNQIDNVAEFLRTFKHHKLDNTALICASLAVLHAQMDSRILDLKAQMVAKKKEISALFNDMRQTEYRLHAVLVHDGRAGSGHYWAYVQDPFSQSKWYLFDDTKVEEVQEQTVWSQSKGGQEGTTSSAYCLMYLHSTSSSAMNSSVGFHPLAGFHPSIASLRSMSSFHALNGKSQLSPTSIPTADTERSESWGSKSLILSSPKRDSSLSTTPPSTPPSSSAIQIPSSHIPFAYSPYSSFLHPQTLLSTSPPLFSARNLLIDSPVLIPVAVKALVEEDNRSFEDEVIQWDLRVIQEMDNAAMAERVKSFVTKYRAKLAACLSDKEGDPKLKSFAHYLLGINSQDLMQYVIAEECYASTFPPTSPSPPSSPSPTTLVFPRVRLEEDQGSEALQRIHTELGGHVQLHLTFSQKAMLSVLQKEYAQFAHVAELYIYAVHYLLDGWFREAVAALLLALKNEQQKPMYHPPLLSNFFWDQYLTQIRYNTTQSSRTGEIRRMLPLCLRRLSAQASELLAHPHEVRADGVSLLSQPLEMAKLVVIGASIYNDLRASAPPSESSPHTHTSMISSLVSPSLLHHVFNHSDSTTNANNHDSCADGSTQDLLAVWENIASNCSDASVRPLCDEIVEICHSCKVKDLEKWIGENSTCQPSLQVLLKTHPQNPPSPLLFNNVHTRHLHANQLLTNFLSRNNHSPHSGSK